MTVDLLVFLVMHKIMDAKVFVKMSIWTKIAIHSHTLKELANEKTFYTELISW